MKKSKSRSNTFAVLFCATILAATGMFCFAITPSCGSSQAVKDTKDKIAGMQESLKTAEDQAKADAAAAKKKADDARDAADAAMAAGDQKKMADAAAAIAAAKEAQAKADKTAEAAAKWQKKLAEATDLLTKATNPDGTVNVNGAVQAAAPLLPPPWNLVALIGAPVAAGALSWLVQQFRGGGVSDNQNAAISLINGISAAAASDPVLASRLQANKGVLLKEYTDTAVDLVDEHKVVVDKPLQLPAAPVAAAA